MDFLSKINANAGIDVKKGQFVAENANVTNFEVRDATSQATSTTISSAKAYFMNSEFDVSAGFAVSVIAGSCRAAKLNMCNGELNLEAANNHIKMNAEFLEFCSPLAPMNIKFNSDYGINIIDSKCFIGNLSFNTEFFKLYYGGLCGYKYSGPAFKITSKLSNSYSDAEDALPTAEIKSQRLDIAAYSKNDNDFTGNITLRATPNQYVDETTKEPIDNDHDATFVVDGYGIHLDSGRSPDGNTIDLYTNGVDGLISLDTSNLEIFANHREVDGNFVGGVIDTQSYSNSISAASYINLQTGGEDTTGSYKSGASIKLSSYLDDGASVKVETTEFLVDLASESSVKFNFGTGLKTHIDYNGITFHNNATISTPADVGGYLSLCSDNLSFVTDRLVVAFNDGGGCMVFSNDGISVSTTPTGAFEALSGNVLLSRSLRSIERMTQSEYDALVVKDENTLYIIAG